MYQLEIKSIGKMPEPVKVFDDQGWRVIALFENKADAEQAARIIRYMRTDNAFEWVRVI